MSCSWSYLVAGLSGEEGCSYSWPLPFAVQFVKESCRLFMAMLVAGLLREEDCNYMMDVYIPPPNIANDMVFLGNRHDQKGQYRCKSQQT